MTMISSIINACQYVMEKVEYSLTDTNIDIQEIQQQLGNYSCLLFIFNSNVINLSLNILRAAGLMAFSF